MQAILLPIGCRRHLKGFLECPCQRSRFGESAGFRQVGHREIGFDEQAFGPFEVDATDLGRRGASQGFAEV